MFVEDELLQSYDEIEHHSVLSPVFPESYMEKGTSNLPKPAKKDIIEVKSLKGHKHERRPRKPKCSIDLNRPASEEDQDEDRAETGDVSKKQRSGNSKFQATTKIEERCRISCR
jgi:hypothetical protein